MTAVPPPVPPEIVDALAAEIRRVDGGHTLGAGAMAEALLPFVGDIVQAARRDALTEAAEAICSHARSHGGITFPEDFEAAARIVTDLRDATAPRTAPAATQADQQPEFAPAPVRGTDEAQKRSEPVFPAWVLQAMDDHQQQAEARMRRLLDEEPTDD